MHRWIRTGSVLVALWLGAQAACAQQAPSYPMEFVAREVVAHEGLSGVYVLERGVDALIARGWLADNARQSIDIQYFIWSTDNIGTLAMASLLFAADRGVRVRIIVDDITLRVPDKTLLALALHPNIDIRIYNPRLSVGVPLPRRLFNVVTDFRGVNQRMHNKAMIVDGNIAIVGGRNMADEYFDYNADYNFRDRDALLLGPVVTDVAHSFQQFWDSALSVPVEERFDGIGLLKKRVEVDDKDVQQVYKELKAYSASPENYPPQMRAAIVAAPREFSRIASWVVWDQVRFISDLPGKNNSPFHFEAGGASSRALAQMVKAAQKDILIQSPYLILSDKAIDLFQAALDRGVRIRISTNSLASTDGLAAFSGYVNQRSILLDMGIELREFKPEPEIEQALVERLVAMKYRPPIFSIHAKTMVIDGRKVFIGTYNLDPRSENLNTELGIVVENDALARDVTAAIEADMAPGNSWDARESPDKYADPVKRSKVLMLRVMPVQPLL
jgi:cardiolipin synthase C